MHRLRIASLFVLLAACDNAPGGLGIGRPAFTAPAAAPLTPVAITAVYAPTSSTESGFVQLENQSGASIDFTATKLWLVSDAGTLDIGSVAGPAVNDQWAAGSRISVAIDPVLQLHPSAGQLAIIDKMGVIQGAATWGIYTPSTGSSSEFATTSAGSGAPFSAANNALPFPVPVGAAVNLDPGVEAVCLDAADLSTSVPCDQKASSLALTRVLPAGLDPNGGYIEVRNLDDTNPIDLFGLQVCTPTCSQLFYNSDDPANPIGVLDPAATSVPAGGIDASRGVINTSHSGQDEGFITSDVAPAPARGEVFLLRPAAANPNYEFSDMLAYVLYAQNANALDANAPNANNAIQAGVWSAGAFVRPATVPGEALTLKDATGGDRTSWEPTSGSAQTTPSTSWSSCSYPQAPAAQTLIFAEVANTTPPRIALVNNASEAVDLSALTLSLGSNQGIALGTAVSPNIDQNQLAVGGQLWIELQSGATCSPLKNVCAANFSAGLGAQEATVLNGNQIIAHVQWAGPLTASTKGDAAVSFGAWAGKDCRAAALPQGLALKLLPKQAGQGSGDYSIGYPEFP